MAKSAVSDWSTTASDNTDIGGINIAQGTTLPSAVDNAIREMMAQIKTAGFVGTAEAVAFTDSLLTIKDNVDATKVAAFQVSGITTGTTRTFTFPDASGTLALTSDIDLDGYAKLDEEDQTVTGGARVASKDLGTITTGTLTLDPGDRPLQHYTNNGAHTLAPGSNAGSIILDITNDASAGAVTLSGWTKVVGAFTTTSGHKFRCSATVGNGGSLLTIQALQ